MRACFFVFLCKDNGISFFTFLSSGSQSVLFVVTVVHILSQWINPELGNYMDRIVGIGLEETGTSWYLLEISSHLAPCIRAHDELFSSNLDRDQINSKQISNYTWVCTSLFCSKPKCSVVAWSYNRGPPGISLIIDCKVDMISNANKFSPKSLFLFIDRSSHRRGILHSKTRFVIEICPFIYPLWFKSANKYIPYLNPWVYPHHLIWYVSLRRGEILVCIDYNSIWVCIFLYEEILSSLWIELWTWD